MSIKKVVISAAGQGTRMLELSKDKSKHLIEVDGKPFLFYLLENIVKAGYSDILIITGYHGELVEEFVRTNFSDQFKATFINQFEVLGPKEKMYGTACPLMCAKDWVGNDQFISLVGDNFYTVEDLKAMGRDDEFCYVAGRIEEHPEKFGVLVEDGEYLKEIVEKPKEFVGNLVNTSLYKFTPAALEKLPLVQKSVRGEYEITDVLSLLAKEKQVKIMRTSNYWIDFGRPEDIEKFAAYIKGEAVTKSA